MATLGVRNQPLGLCRGAEIDYVAAKHQRVGSAG
jgi:hypothetical protein